MINKSKQHERWDVLNTIADKREKSKRHKNHYLSNTLISRNQLTHISKAVRVPRTPLHTITPVNNNITGEQYSCLTTLDIKKAFDSVDHELLLYKMCNLFNFHSSTIKLMANYLTSRCQYLKTYGAISTRMPVLSGVPQGSVLGQLMFIMFVNNLAHTCPCYLFADDCVIEQCGNTLFDAVTTTNELLPTAAKWYENNLLKLNTSKTYVMMLANRQIDTDQLKKKKKNTVYWQRKKRWINTNT